MHLLLTDRLFCPRCGPGFGLVLWADRLEERRVHGGHLGCANCRERYPIDGGVADLRPAPRTPGMGVVTASHSEDLDPTTATAIAAAMGAGQGGRPVLLVGEAARWLPALVPLLPEDVDVVVAQFEPSVDANGVHGLDRISRVIVGDVWPFGDASFGGVTVAGPQAEPTRLRTLGRLLDPRHRLVVLDPPEGIQVRLGGAGLTRFVQAPGIAAASR